MKKTLSRVLVAVMITAMLLLSLAGCANKENTGAFQSDKINSDLSVAESVQSYYDALDVGYGYDLAKTLAYDEKYWDNDLGWRTAGSDAEHRCADFLADEMNKIGLADVEKVAVDCDRFQFNGSCLTLEGTDIKLEPASYQCSGTDGDLTAEIVNCGTGFEADYEGLDVEGKIALVAVNQADESWIDNYILQAHEKGAAAIVTYSIGGYGLANDDTINVQDICCRDLIPTVAISKAQGTEIAKQIEAGNNMATLNVDTEFEIGCGTTYNVVGKIPGKSHDQQIIISGHYDKYWYGFQDDSAAIALVYTIAKGMKDSGYTPENDIIFIAHGAEEWGVSDSCFDWTRGAWEMIEKMEEWQGTTLALLNCELPAYSVSDNVIAVSCVPEFRTMASKLINESGLLVTAGDIGISTESVDSTTMEDGISYRWHGVPYFINSGCNDMEFMYNNYHTTEDNADTYDEDVFKTNLNWYGAFAMYIDSAPALELDMTQTAGDLEQNLNDEIDGEAGVNLEEYKSAAESFEDSAAALNEQIQALNSKYEEAVKSGKSDEAELNKMREEGKALNKKNLEAFAASQNAFCKSDDFAVYYGHPNMTYNVEYLDGVLAGLDNGVLWGDNEDGALDFAWQINGAHDYNYMLFSKEIADEGNDMYDPKVMDPKKTLWGYDRSIEVLRVGEATYELAQLEDLDGVDVSSYRNIYSEARTEALECIKKYAENEIRAMKEIASKL